MSLKIGRVIDYENGYGKLVSEDGMYFFLDTDVKDFIEKGMLVNFEGEEIEKNKRAFFIRKYENIESKQKIYQKD